MQGKIRNRVYANQPDWKMTRTGGFISKNLADPASVCAKRPAESKGVEDGASPETAIVIMDIDETLPDAETDLMVLVSVCVKRLTDSESSETDPSKTHAEPATPRTRRESVSIISMDIDDDLPEADDDLVMITPDAAASAELSDDSSDVSSDETIDEHDVAVESEPGESNRHSSSPGLKPLCTGRCSPEEDAMLKSLRERGVLYVDIGKRLNRTARSCINRCHTANPREWSGPLDKTRAGPVHPAVAIRKRPGSKSEYLKHHDPQYGQQNWTKEEEDELLLRVAQGYTAWRMWRARSAVTRQQLAEEE
ncbi:hypothetical protein B0T22DRAFT_436553 [Podospora appendiculata]|uniref:Myb-like domain-containing protein n=1 Tax=Podospora appendiculata TaxID=314037 RepID=A0AAE0XH88_9PEZI|nr:hypothetical protein B0T22DRAFT_436553 [Podospora appendiculata]